MVMIKTRGRQAGHPVSKEARTVSPAPARHGSTRRPSMDPQMHVLFGLAVGPRGYAPERRAVVLGERRQNLVRGLRPLGREALIEVPSPSATTSAIKTPTMPGLGRCASRLAAGGRC